MTVQFYPNGIGGTAPGDSLDLARPLQTTGNVWYVSSLTGTNAASPAGQNREKPLATVAQAITNAVADDIIVFLPGHTETLTASQAVAKSLTFIGEGITGGLPAVSFTWNAAAGNMFNVTAAATEFRNLYFTAGQQNNSGFKIIMNGGADDGLVRGCYFACGATDQGAAVILAANRVRIESSTFISTATLTSAQPLAAIMASGALTGLTMKDVVVSAGTVGFSNYAAVDLTGGTWTRLRLEGISLLLGADMTIPAAATGRVNVQLSTGGSRVAWS